jgi:hypothetical protein
MTEGIGETLPKRKPGGKITEKQSRHGQAGQEQ